MGRNQKEGGRHVKKNRAHKTFGPIKIIYNDQAACYLIYSRFQSTFYGYYAKTKKDTMERGISGNWFWAYLKKNSFVPF